MACVKTEFLPETPNIRVGVKGFYFGPVERRYSFPATPSDLTDGGGRGGLTEKGGRNAATVVQPPEINRKRRRAQVHLRRPTVT